jgi:hypothetical protein
VARLTKKGFSPRELIKRIQSRMDKTPHRRMAISDSDEQTDDSFNFATKSENGAPGETSVRAYVKCAAFLPTIPSTFLPAIEAFNQQGKNVNTAYTYLSEAPLKGWPWCVFRRIVTTGKIGPAVQTSATPLQDVCFVVQIDMERDADTLLERLEHEVRHLETESSRLYQNGCSSCVVSNKDGSFLLCFAVGFRTYRSAVFCEEITEGVF